MIKRHKAIKMVSPSFTNFLLILICLLLRFSTGFSLQVKRSIFSTGIKPQTDRSSLNAEEQGIPEMDERTKIREGERTKESRRLSKVMESQHYWIAKASSSSSTTDGEQVHCIEDCDNGKRGNSNAKRKFSKKSHHSLRAINMSGFVSWNADYHVPRPHPPKNN